MILVTPTPSDDSNLSLVSNFCGPLMRKAKNFTFGVTRSVAGKSKQRRYNKNNNKRKQPGSSETVSSTSQAEDDASSSPTTSLQIVTSFGLRTLLLEDMWFIENGTPIALFFNIDILPPRYGKKWTKVWCDTSQSNYVPLVLFEGRSYRQITGWVLKKPDLRSVTGVQVYDDIILAMKEKEQRGIHFKFPVFSSDDCQFPHPPTACIGEALTWFEVFNYPQGVFVQADYHPERSWNHIFKRLKVDNGDRLTLLHCLVQETPGDCYVLAEIKHIWERLQVKQNQAQAIEEHHNVLAELLEALAEKNAPPSPIIEPAKVDKFCNLIDERLWQRMEDCFGRLNNIFE